MDVETETNDALDLEGAAGLFEAAAEELEATFQEWTTKVDAGRTAIDAYVSLVAQGPDDNQLFLALLAAFGTEGFQAGVYRGEEAVTILEVEGSRATPSQLEGVAGELVGALIDQVKESERRGLH